MNTTTSTAVVLLSDLFDWTTRTTNERGQIAQQLVAQVKRSTVDYPWYHARRPEVVPGLADRYSSVVAPLVAYWSLSLLFTLIDELKLPFFEKYRIHEPEEVTSKNRVTKRQVVWTVLLQQAVQTAVGLVWIEDDNPSVGPMRDHSAHVDQYALRIAQICMALLGESTGPNVFRRYGGYSLANWTYWWGVPLVQFAFAAFVLDAWQYFWHRYFHVNKFLYRHVHSWHHRLYVPYAYGALYNHPLEGFILDTLSAGIAQSASFMTTRQAILFFGLSTAKTVDDHCGFALPFDPFQFLFANNVDYHDIHHQIAGLKKNFSQPYFIHFDNYFGTKMTRREFEQKKWAKRQQGKVQESKVNGPNEIASVPTSQRSHMALKQD